MSRLLLTLVFLMSLATSVSTEQGSILDRVKAPAAAPDCVQDPARVAAYRFCRADYYLRLFKPELRGDSVNDRWLQFAVTELREAAERSRGTPDFVVALQRLIDLYTPAYLNDPTMADPLFHAWIEAAPSDLRPRIELFAMLEANGQRDIRPTVTDLKELQDPNGEWAKQLAAFRQKWRQTASSPLSPIAAPAVVKRVDPIYPELSQKARIQGVVIIEVRINEAGKVIDARVLRSIPMLDQAALDAVRQWEFAPTIVNGKAVPVTASVTVQFTLTPGANEK